MVIRDVTFSLSHDLPRPSINLQAIRFNWCLVKKKKKSHGDYNASPKLLCCSPRLKPITHVCLTWPFQASAKHFSYTILFTVFNFSFTNGRRSLSLARHSQRSSLIKEKNKWKQEGWVSLEYVPCTIGDLSSLQGTAQWLKGLSIGKIASSMVGIPSTV